MDKITAVSSIGIALFMASHICMSRMVREKFRIRWLLKLPLFISGGILLLNGTAQPVVSVLAVLLFVSEWLVYMLTIYSFSEASITLRLLSEVARNGVKGVSKQEILRRYNKEKIVQRRITRLLESGEMQKVGNTYELTGSVSGFTIRHAVNNVFFKLFPKLP